MGLRDEALKMHSELAGKIEVVSRIPLRNKDDLSLAYTPGVAEPCKEIAANEELSFEYTGRGNMVAVVSDGTAVLGLGDIGPAAAMPVMEGKCLLFKCFAGVNAFPLCVATKDVDEIVNLVRLIEPSIGGVNLEDISAPRCFAIERQLKERMSIPVFHDDQHGTAIVVLSAVLNAVRVVGKCLADVTVVINGAGSGGIATCRLLLDAGIKDAILCDTKGAVYQGRPAGMNPDKDQIASVTNRGRVTGGLGDALVGADIFVGLSVANCVSTDMVRSMADHAIVFPMANPVPEIMPDLAVEAGAAVIGTGRSDFANQINNVLAFPGVLRGALDVRARDITDGMKLAAARAIAELISADELSPDYIIPRPFDRRVAPAVAAAVARTAIDTGIARLNIDPAAVSERTRELVERVQARWTQE